MKRRAVLSGGGTLAAAAATAAATMGATMGAPAFAQQAPTLRWRMPSSFPKTLDTVFGGAPAIADMVRELTDGRFVITPAAAGELVPPLAVLDAVQNGTVECGHTAGFYYIGKESALVFDTGVPFGMTPRQHASWMTHGGGLDLMRSIYERFNVVQFPAGNTGAQMGGWFRKEIRQPEDLAGLRMRVPGLLGKVYAKLGVTPQQLPAGDVYPALEKGVLDAAEFVGPYDDEKLGLAKVAKYYYAPGVMELNASVCMIVNRSSWNDLPPAYKAALRAACAYAATDMLGKYDALNAVALKRVIGSGAQLSFWPRPVMDALNKATQDVMAEESAANETFAKVHAHWRGFLDNLQTWAAVNDGAAEQYLLGSRRRS